MNTRWTPSPRPARTHRRSTISSSRCSAWRSWSSSSCRVLSSIWPCAIGCAAGRRLGGRRRGRTATTYYGDDEYPEQVHGNLRLELAWTIIPDDPARGHLGVHAHLPRRVEQGLRGRGRPPGDRRGPAVVVGVPVPPRRRHVDTAGHRDRQRDGDPRAASRCPWRSRRGMSSTPSGSRASTGRSDAVPGAHAPVGDRGRRDRSLHGPVHRVLRPLARLHAHVHRRAGRRRSGEQWVQGPDCRMRCRCNPAKPGYEGQELFLANCANCHVVNGVTDVDLDGATRRHQGLRRRELHHVRAGGGSGSEPHPRSRAARRSRVRSSTSTTAAPSGSRTSRSPSGATVEPR